MPTNLNNNENILRNQEIRAINLLANKNPKVQNNFIVGSRETVENNKAVATRVNKKRKNGVDFDIGLTGREIVEKEIAGQRSDSNTLGISKIEQNGNNINITSRNIDNIKIKNISIKASEGAKKRNNWIIWLKQIQIHLKKIYNIDKSYTSLINKISTTIWNQRIICEGDENYIIAPFSPLFMALFLNIKSLFLNNLRDLLLNNKQYISTNFNEPDPNFDKEQYDQIILDLDNELERVINNNFGGDDYNNFLLRSRQKYYFNRFINHTLLTENQILSGETKENICNFFNNTNWSMKRIKKRIRNNRNEDNIDEEVADLGDILNNEEENPENILPINNVIQNENPYDNFNLGLDNDEEGFDNLDFDENIFDEISPQVIINQPAVKNIKRPQSKKLIVYNDGNKIKKINENLLPHEIFELNGKEIIDAKIIKQKYKKLLLKNHPDRVSNLNSNDKKIATNNTTIINEAYRLLIEDIERRKANNREIRKDNPEFFDVENVLEIVEDYLNPNDVNQLLLIEANSSINLNRILYNEILPIIINIENTIHSRAIEININNIPLLMDAVRNGNEQNVPSKIRKEIINKTNQIDKVINKLKKQGINQGNIITQKTRNQQSKVKNKGGRILRNRS